MDWRWSGDRPLPEPTMTRSTDAYTSLHLNECKVRCLEMVLGIAPEFYQTDEPYRRMITFLSYLSYRLSASLHFDICYNTWRMLNMMTSSNGNIFRVTGPLWREFTGNRWIPLTKSRDAELWCFIRSGPQQMVEQAIEMPVIWDVIELIMTSL